MAKKKNKGADDILENNINKSTDKTIVKHADTNPDKYQYIVNNTKARRATKYRNVVIVTAIVVVIVLIISAIIFGAYTMIQVNSFKVFVDTEGNQILSLSTDKNFVPPNDGSQILNVSGPENMDNTTLASGKSQTDTPTIEDRLETILNTDGFECDSNDSFIASTFYLKNITTETQSFTEQLALKEVSQDIDSALRVMLVRNNDIIVYGKYDINEETGEKIPVRVVPLPNNEIYPAITIEEKTTTDGLPIYKISQPNSNDAETNDWYTEDFYNTSDIFHNENITLEPGEVIRYSFVVWLEGWDKDCIDDKLYGTIRMDLSFIQQEQK